MTRSPEERSFNEEQKDPEKPLMTKLVLPPRTETGKEGETLEVVFNSILRDIYASRAELWNKISETLKSLGMETNDAIDFTDKILEKYIGPNKMMGFSLGKKTVGRPVLKPGNSITKEGYFENSGPDQEKWENEIIAEIAQKIFKDDGAGI